MRRLVDLAYMSAIAVAAWFLWPASLGGHTRLIAVEGRSMEPTYHLGDAVIARDNPNPKVGDVIIYHIPKGQPAAGLLVIHRVSALWPDGTYQTQGDNRSSPDPSHIVSGDIIGTPVLTLPHFSRFIGLSSSPAAIGASTGLVATFVLWPTKAKNHSRDPHQADKPGHDDSRVDQDRIDAEARAWLDTELALIRSPATPDQDRIDAEARAWLDTELALIRSPARHS